MHLKPCKHCKFHGKCVDETALRSITKQIGSIFSISLYSAKANCSKFVDRMPKGVKVVIDTYGQSLERISGKKEVTAVTQSRCEKKPTKIFVKLDEGIPITKDWTPSIEVVNYWCVPERSIKIIDTKEESINGQ